MRKLYYSPDTLGFYDTSIHDEIPQNSVEISAEEYALLFPGQADGKVINLDGSGSLILTDRAQPSEEDLKAAAFLQRDVLLQRASIRIAPLQDAIDLDKATAAEKGSLLSWKQYRIDLNRIDQQDGFPASINWPSSPE